jgi:hypothetical protein
MPLLVKNRLVMHEKAIHMNRETRFGLQDFEKTIFPYNLNIDNQLLNDSKNNLKKTNRFIFVHSPDGNVQLEAAHVPIAVYEIPN